MENFESLSLYLAYSFIRQFCNSKNPYEELDAAEKKYGINKALILAEKGKLLDLVSRMTNDFKDVSKDFLDDIYFYFREIDDNGSHEPVSGLILLTDINEFLRCPSVDALRDFLISLPDDEYDRRFMDVLKDYDNSMLKGTEPSSDPASQDKSPDVIDISRYILKMGLPESLLYRLEQIYLNRQVHIEKLCMILSKTVEFITTYSDELTPIIDEFYAYWARVQGSREFYQFITEDFKFLSQIEYYDRDCLLIPNMHLVEFSVHIPDKKASGIDKAIFNIGLLYGNSLSVNDMLLSDSSHFPAEKAVDALKLLSDKSRFEIMKYIKNHNAYGNEIAEHLGLTTATVSHHMSLLFEAGLITLEQKDGKIYYHINRDTVSQYINYYEEKLL